MDGGVSNSSGVPKQKKGEMELKLHQQNDQESELAFSIKCFETSEQLITNIYGCSNSLIASHATV